jgi:hypothetical protein
MDRWDRVQTLRIPRHDFGLAVIGMVMLFEKVMCLNLVTFSLLGQGFGLVVRAAGWHVGDPGSILGRDGLYTFGCIPPAP